MENEKKVRARAIIKGKVQGVYFRMETRMTAERHGVYGWVKNNRDGSVEAVFEGEADRVQAVLDWCHKGPPHAKVSDVVITWEKYTGEYNDFRIVF